VFQPLVTGCQALLNQGTLGGLANTGSPILIALAGLLLIGTGSLVYRRSGAPAPLASSPGRGIARDYNGRIYGLNAVRRRLAWQRVQR
jgi:LPXTG-motif cell wall-anchored protein